MPAFSAQSKANATSGLECRLRKSLNFSDGTDCLDVAIKIPSQQWIALLGPSGAGKTSLLRLLAGLADADEGYIRIGDEWWLDTVRKIAVPTRSRRTGFVFQDHALFPHMNVWQNIEFARPRGADRAVITELLDLTGLSGLAKRYPAQLSGGQQQRLALARALATDPRLLLLDEPLSALDGPLRAEMQDLLLRIRDRSLVDCALLVTHDATEAARLTDRVVRLDHGAVIADTSSSQDSANICPHCFHALSR